MTEIARHSSPAIGGATADAIVRPLRLAVLADYCEEGWPSMDLAAEMLVAPVMKNHSAAANATLIRPAFRHRLGRLMPGSDAARNADRLLNRLRDYPRELSRIAGDFDAFHVVDHSYGQLVHRLPADRTGVFCHDLDTFRSILAPRAEPRPWWFRRMARHILHGMQKAAVVFHATRAVRRQIEAHGLVDPAKLVHAPLGVAPQFSPTPSADVALELPQQADRRFVLNVGSCIPRKRIDVLLSVFGRLAAADPDLRLIQVGGEWTDEQRRQIELLRIAGRVVQTRGITRAALAELYRRARVVVQPTEAEGFGLPIVEALACGATVVASDIEVLREVGGDAVIYRPVGDDDAWADAVLSVLHGRVSVDPATRAAQARRFSWTAHAETILRAYQRLAAT